MSPEAGWPWSELGLEGKADAKEVRRAYASKLKTIDQATDIEGFTALRTAYDVALRMAGAGGQPAAPIEVIRPDAREVRPEPVPPPQPWPEPESSKPVTEEKRSNSQSDEPVTSPRERPAKPPEDQPLSEIETVLASLNLRGDTHDPGRRIRAALNSPALEDPENAGRIGDAIRRLLHDSILARSVPVLDYSIDRPTLKAINARFAFMDDYKTLNAWFRGNDLLQQVLDRLYDPEEVNAELIKSERRAAQIKLRLEKTAIFLATPLTLATGYMAIVPILTISKAISASLPSGAIGVILIAIFYLIGAPYYYAVRHLLLRHQVKILAIFAEWRSALAIDRLELIPRVALFGASLIAAFFGVVLCVARELVSGQVAGIMAAILVFVVVILHGLLFEGQWD